MNFELLRARKEAGLTQQELAGMVGIERSTYTRIEQAKTIPFIDIAYKLAEVLNKPVEKIFLPEIVYGKHKNGTE